MTGKNKLLLTLVVAGLIMAGIGYVCGASTMVYLDGSRKLSVPQKGEISRYEIPADQIKGLEVKLGVGNVTVMGWDETTASVEIDSNWGDPPVYAFEGGVIQVKDRENASWLSVGLFVDQKNHVTVKLPKGQYDVLVTGGTSRINLENLTPAALEVTNGTGDIVAKNVACDGARLVTGTGAISMEKWSGRDLYAKTATGRIQIRGDLTGEARAESGTGSISLSTLKADDQYRIKASTGTGGISAPSGNDQAVNAILVHTGTGGIKVQCAVQDAMG